MFSLLFSLILETCNSNDNLDLATVIQEIEFSGFVRHIMDAASIFFLV